MDGGAYLEGLRRTLGGDDHGVGFPRPPLAPGFLLWPFIELFGIDTGYKVWSSIASVLPAIPVFLLARRIDRALGDRPHRRLPLSPAVFAAGFLMLDMLHAEMMVTGALPLIAFALLGMVWWAMGELVEDWSLLKAAILAASLGLIPWVNQTTAGLAIVTIPVYGAALLWFNNSSSLLDSNPRRALGTPTGVALRLAVPLFIGGLIALGALPWYLDVLPVTGVLNYPGSFIYLSPWTDSSWLQLALAWPVGLFIVWKGGQPWLRSLGVLILLLGSLTPFLSTDETVINIFYRSRYLLAIPFYVAVAWIVWVKVLPALPMSKNPLFVIYGRQGAFLAGLGVAALLVVGNWWTFNNQAGLSNMVSRNTEIALDIAKAEDDKAIINNSFTLALWIAALNDVEAPHTWTWQPPPTWRESDRLVRCALGWVPSCDPEAAITVLDAGWVLIEGRFPFYNNRAPGVYGSLDYYEPWGNLPDVEWLDLVYQQGTTDLYRIVSTER